MAFEQMRIRLLRFDSVLSEHCGEIKSPAECRKKSGLNISKTLGCLCRSVQTVPMVIITNPSYVKE